MRTGPRPSVGKVTLSAMAFGLLLAHSPAQEVEKHDDDPVAINPFAAQPESDAARMIRLFQEVEQRMNRSTELLFNASKGDLGDLGQIQDSGLADLGQDADESTAPSRAALASLLAASQAEGTLILSGIDEILEIAARNGGT